MSVRRAASASVWSTLDLALRQGVQFAVSLILARLLAPADFGVIAILAFFATFVINVVQGGLSTAIIQRQDTSAIEESSLFWVNLVASSLLGGFLLLIAPALARFYALPVLQPLMLITAAQVVLGALGAVHNALLTRELRFDRLVKAGVVSAILSGVTGITAAMNGFGVWALALQGLVSIGANSAALWLLCGWRPTAGLRFSALRSLIGFGGWVSLSSALDVLYTQGFSLLVGKLHGITDLGFYNRAYGTQLLPANLLSSVLGRVALPAFSSRTDDKEGIRRGMRLANSFGMLINAPIMIGLALLSRDIVVTLFGAKWLPAAPILSILALSGLLLPLHVINLQVLLAHGEAKLFFKIEISKKLFSVFAVAIGSLFGIVGLAWSQVLVSAVSLLFNARPAKRRFGYGLAAQFRDISGVALATAIMAAAVFALTWSVALPPLLELLVAVPLGAAVYAMAGFGLRLHSFTEALEVGRGLFARPETV